MHAYRIGPSTISVTGIVLNPKYVNQLTAISK